MNLRIEPIDLEKAKELCVEFRRDSFVVSFGDDANFVRECGTKGEKYIEWLHQKISQDPYLAVHFYEGDKVIGQMELGYLKGDASVGYVNLYYLELNSRGKGYGEFLDHYAMNFFRAKNIQRVRLSVSPTNVPAVKFYVKMGWKDLGPREGMPEVHWMEKQI